MNKDISNKLINYGKNNESIEAIYYIDDSYDSFIHIYTIVNEVIVGKMEDELVELFDNVIMLNRQKGEFLLEKGSHTYTSLTIYTNDNLKFRESIISSDVVDDFIKTFPGKLITLYTRPGFDKIDTDTDFEFAIPKEYEVISTIKNFFAKAYETSLFINEKDSISACLKMEEVRSYLTTMVNFYIKNK